MRKKLGLAFLLSLGIVATTSLGFSSWIIPSLLFTATPQANETEAVAYVKETQKYYATIEGALNAANSNGGVQTVYVIPGISAEEDRPDPIEITSSVTIGPNVSLILPYSGENYENLQSTGSPSDNSLSSRKSKMKTEVLLSDGCTLTVSNGGSLVVGGEIGYTQPFGGAVFGNFTQISLGIDSHIECYGTMRINGFVKPLYEEYESMGENRPSVNFHSGADARFPMVVYDFAGGTGSLSSYVSGRFPFNTFDLPNVTPLVNVDRGVVLNGVTSLQMAGFWLSPTISLISQSSSAVIALSEGSLAFDYEPSSSYTVTLSDGTTMTRGLSDITKTSKAATTYLISGNCTINNLNVPLAGDLPDIIESLGITSISTEGLFLPFSYKWLIELRSGTCTFPSSINARFLPGSSFVIDPGATWQLGGQAIFYSQGYSGNGYDTNLDDARLINNGSTVVNGKIGGYMRTTADNAYLYTSRNCSFSVSADDLSSSGNVTISQDFFIDRLVNANIEKTSMTSFDTGSSYIFRSSKEESADFGWFDQTEGKFPVTINTVEYDGSRNLSYVVTLTSDGVTTSYNYPSDFTGLSLYLLANDGDSLTISAPDGMSLEDSGLAYIEEGGNYSIFGSSSISYSLSGSISLNVVPTSLQPVINSMHVFMEEKEMGLLYPKASFNLSIHYLGNIIGPTYYEGSSSSSGWFNKKHYWNTTYDISDLYVGSVLEFDDVTRISNMNLPGLSKVSDNPTQFIVPAGYSNSSGVLELEVTYDGSIL